MMKIKSNPEKKETKGKANPGRFWKVIGAIIIIIIISVGFYFLLSSLGHEPIREIKRMTVYNKESCEKLGGGWGKIGLSDEEGCNLPTMDKDKSCTDISQCQGECIADLAAAKEGKCSQYKINMGCLFRMRDGKVIEICMD